MGPMKPDDESAADGWGTDYAAALALAKKEQKAVLADFTGSDWCGWCVRLKAEVFDTPEFEKWAAQNVVLLELDYPQRKQLPDGLMKQNDELARKYGIQGYPTILFFDAAGKAIGRMGYEPGGPASWTRNAQRIVDAIKAKG